MTTIKNGSKNGDVKICQELLNKYGNYGLIVDGVFGTNTEKAVKDFQKKNGLVADGIVGSNTWKILFPSELVIENHLLNPGQYLSGNYPVDYVVLHHTAGWDNPYQTIDNWNTDTQGRIATEFVIGGQRSTDGRSTYDGIIARAYPEGCMGYHIGNSGSSYMNTHACGIELCNMGYVKDGKTYVNTPVIDSQKYKTDFRGYNEWHKYSDKQLESLRKLLLYIAERDNIDLHKGLYEWIKKEGKNAFEFHSDAYYGNVKKGLITHANIRKDKFDVHPQPELIDMILSL